MRAGAIRRLVAPWGVALALGCGAGEWEGGIHAQLAFHRTRGLRIVEVPEGPGREAGLAPGDRVVAIDGAPVEGRTLEEIRTSLRGPVGTEVELEVVREGEPEETRTVRVVRAPYQASGG